MEQILITELLWDSFNVEHIEKHNVKITEIEEALQDEDRVFRETYKERILALGRSSKRLIATVLSLDKATGLHYVITARDMDKKERQIYRKEYDEKNQNKNT